LPLRWDQDLRAVLLVVLNQAGEAGGSPFHNEKNPWFPHNNSRVNQPLPD
jgi:hypothetical protein